MQLGTRWRVGAAAPAKLPEAVRSALADVEHTVSEPASRSWTLTWLEGCPILTLDRVADDEAVTVIRYRSDTDTATISAGNPGEEWVEDEL